MSRKANENESTSIIVPGTTILYQILTFKEKFVNVPGLESCEVEMSQDKSELVMNKGALQKL